MRFLLRSSGLQSNFAAIDQRAAALQRPRPDKADDEYISAPKTLIVGQLKFTVRSYDADPANGSTTDQLPGRVHDPGRL
jgi:hypothetical protein